MKNSMFLVVTLILSMVIMSGFSTAMSFYFKPLNSTNDLQSNKQYNYTLNFTLNYDCTGVVLSNISSITTGPDGIGFIDVDISSISQLPNYLCEYRNGTLRKAHNFSDIIFNRVSGSAKYFNNISTYNSTYALYAYNQSIYDAYNYSIYIPNNITKLSINNITNFLYNYNQSGIITYNSTYHQWAFNQSQASSIPVNFTHLTNFTNDIFNNATIYNYTFSYFCGGTDKVTGINPNGTIACGADATGGYNYSLFTNHSELNTLQGGQANQYYHLNLSVYTQVIANAFNWITDALTSSIANNTYVRLGFQNQTTLSINNITDFRFNYNQSMYDAYNYSIYIPNNITLLSINNITDFKTQIYNKTEVDSIIPSLLTYYFWDTNSTVNPVYNVMNITQNPTATNHNASSLTNGAVIIYRINENTNLTSISGVLHLHTTANKTGGTKDLQIQGQLNKRDINGVVTPLGSTDVSPILVNGIATNIDLFATIPQTNLDISDMLLWQLNAVVSGGGTAPSVRIQVGGTTQNGLDLPVTLNSLSETDPIFTSTNPSLARYNFGSNNFNGTGNITAGFFIGNGTTLTGLCLSNGTNCVSATSDFTSAIANNTYRLKSDVNITYNSTYALWAYNQTGLITYNITYNQWAFNQSQASSTTINFTHLSNFTNDIFKNGSFFNSTYNQWAFNQSNLDNRYILIGTGTSNFTHLTNFTNDIFLNGTFYNSTYNQWSFNQSNLDARYALLAWGFNQSDLDYRYRMRGEPNITYNSTYAQWAFNQSQASSTPINFTHLSNFTNDIFNNATYGTWAFNQSDSIWHFNQSNLDNRYRLKGEINESYNATYAEMIREQCIAGKVANGTYPNGTIACVTPSSDFTSEVANWTYPSNTTISQWINMINITNTIQQLINATIGLWTDKINNTVTIENLINNSIQFKISNNNMTFNTTCGNTDVSVGAWANGTVKCTATSGTTNHSLLNTLEGGLTNEWYHLNQSAYQSLSQRAWNWNFVSANITDSVWITSTILNNSNYISSTQLNATNYISSTVLNASTYLSSSLLNSTYQKLTQANNPFNQVLNLTSNVVHNALNVTLVNVTTNLSVGERICIGECWFNRTIYTDGTNIIIYAK